MLDLLDDLVTWPLDKKKTVVVMDQATYHTPNVALKRCLDEGISVMFLPASSSEL